MIARLLGCLVAEPSNPEIQQPSNSKSISRLERQRTSVGIRVESRLRSCQALRRDVRKLRAEADRRTQIEEPRQSPGATALRIRFCLCVIVIVGSKNVDARRDTVAAECLRQQSIRGVETEVYTSAGRETHSRRAPTVLCSECRPVLAIQLPAQKIEARLPGVFVSIFLALATVVLLGLASFVWAAWIHEYAESRGTSVEPGASEVDVDSVKEEQAAVVPGLAQPAFTPCHSK